MTPYPEELGAPIVGPAIESILADQFRDELAHGTPDHQDGTHPGWMRISNDWLAKSKAASQAGEMTFTHLLFAQTFEVASKTEANELRRALASLGGTIVQWIESLDRRFGGA